MVHARRVREIRVHGVSGTPAHAMLGVAPYEIEQVSGDEITGLYRCRPGSAPRGVDVPAGVQILAYSWGALTSGAAGGLGAVRRALWLTLLPFALGNLSYWARPELDRDDRTKVATAVAIREACLALTVLFTAAMCVIGVDMIAWQCFRGGTAVCPALPSQLGFLAQPPWDLAGRRMLIGSLLPLGALALLWWLSKGSLRRYEAQTSEFAASGGLGVLSRRRMWAGDVRTQRLQRLHIAAGLVLVVMFGLVPAVRYAGHDWRWWAACVLLAVAACLLATAAVVVGISYRDGIDFPGVHAGWADRVAKVLPWLAVAVVGAYAVLMAVLQIPERFDDPGLTQGRNMLVGALIMVLFAVVAWLVFASDRAAWALLLPLSLGAVAVLSRVSLPLAGLAGLATIIVTAGLQSRRRDPVAMPRAWRGAGPAMILGAAVWVAALFTTSLVIFTGNWLNGSQTVTQLQSEFSVQDSPGAFAARVQAGDPVLIATGQVVIRDGVLQRAAPDFYVLREGTVSASSVTTADADVFRATPALDMRAGLVLIDDPPVQLIDTCVGVPGGACEPVDTWLYSLAAPLAIDGPVAITVDTVPQEPIVVPQVLIWFAGVTVVCAIVTAAAVLLALLVFLRGRRAIGAQRRADGITARGRARFFAAFTHRAERLLSLGALVTSACALLLIVGTVSGWQPWRDNGLVAGLVNGGLWVAMLLSAGLVLLVGKLLNASGFWRMVGILWDLTTFWPRVAHPLGPPCYAERVVPELVDELMTTPADTRVIVSAHSQGSLIAVAMLAQVASIRQDLGSVRFIAYGSQLRTWYGRIFPAVLGPQILGNAPMTAAPGLTTAAPDAPDPGSNGALVTPPAGPATLGGLLAINSADPHWVTLFRRTDPIGFRVFGDQSSLVDRYVSEYDPQGDPHSHSEYQFSSEYIHLVESWYT